MQSKVTTIFEFIQGHDAFIVPVYQRNYSWDEDECATLYDDMVALHHKRQAHQDTGLDCKHFIGSMVFQSSSDLKHPGLILIDGQQRILTMYLFYLALLHVAQEHTDQEVDFATTIEQELLLNTKGEQRLALSSKEDQTALDKLIVGNQDEYLRDSRLTQSYEYFHSKLSAATDQKELTLADFYHVSQHLTFVTIMLDASDDEPQLVFESLNAKGKPLDEAELIKNFLLIGLSPDQAQNVYQEQWVPIELNCNQTYDYDCDYNVVTDLTYYYLAIKQGKLPNYDKMYREFRNFYQTYGVERPQIAEEMNQYSRAFKSVFTATYKLAQDKGDLQAEIEHGLKRLRYLNTYQANQEVYAPFLMQAMWLQRQNEITAAELAESIALVETVIVRYWVYNFTLQPLCEFFACLPKKIEALQRSKKAGRGFINKLKYALRSDKDVSLPDDEQFREALVTGRFYYANNYYSCNNYTRYILACLDSFEHLEYVDILKALEDNNKAYTVEHIMPQELNKAWRKELGPNAQELYEIWLNRLGNLTITAYNSKLSNKTFAEKRDMPNGYRDSALHLNKDIAKHEHWREEDLKQRAEELATKALQIWPYPNA